MPNTNGMRFPMTAVEDIEHNGISAKKGEVFDAVSKANAEDFKRKGAREGDVYNEPHSFGAQFKSGLSNSVDGPAVADTQPSGTARALDNPDSAIAQNASISGTPGSTPPEAPALGIDTEKSEGEVQSGAATENVLGDSTEPPQNEVTEIKDADKPQLGGGAAGVDGKGEGLTGVEAKDVAGTANIEKTGTTANVKNVDDKADADTATSKVVKRTK